jgi:hypothetical protein
MSWLSTLRRWRKAVVLATLPTLLSSTLAAGACNAMPMPSATTGLAHHPTTHPAQAAADVGGPHHHHATAADGPGDTEPSAPCPHCRSRAAALVRRPCRRGAPDPRGARASVSTAFERPAQPSLLRPARLSAAG